MAASREREGRWRGGKQPPRCFSKAPPAPQQDWEGNLRHAEYSRFALGNELNSYRLFLGNYSGDVGNDALLYHNNTAFSTKDKDNDNCLDKCAQLRKGEVRGGLGGWSQRGRTNLKPDFEPHGPAFWLWRF